MFAKILAAIDSSPLAPRVLEATGELASKFDSQVLVVHVRDIIGPAEAMAAAAGRAGGIIRHVPPSLENEEIAAGLVENAVEALSARDIAATGEVSAGWGSAAHELLRIAASYQPDLIVAGNRGAT